jgi:hypothetical protein
VVNFIGYFCCSLILARRREGCCALCYAVVAGFIVDDSLPTWLDPDSKILSEEIPLELDPNTINPVEMRASCVFVG